MHFYLIRHGQTDWNVSRKLQGHSDIPLNSRGHEQAKAAVSHLKDLQLTQLFASDLSRASQTARILAEGLGGVAVSEHSELREIHLGEAEGFTREKMAIHYGEEFFGRWSSADPRDFNIGFPGGETKNQALARFDKFLRDTMKTSDGGPIAFVSHGLILKSWLCSYQPMLKDTLLIPNLSLLEVQWDGRGPRLKRQLETTTTV